MIEENVGGYDRLARWIIGGGLVFYGLQTRGWRRWLALSAASSVLSTASLKRCLMNRLLGINTTRAEEKWEEAKKSIVDEASEESFPASDAPAFSGGR